MGKTGLTFFFLVICAASQVWPGSVHAAPPGGFTSSVLVNNGLTAPTALGIAPDGRIFILEQGGKIKIYKNGSLLPKVFDELSAYADSDRGLLGIAFDPDFATNKYVYFYYVDSVDLMHKVVRFNAAGDVATDGPVLIYESGFAAGSNHAGGTIQFGPDKKMYIGIGDSGSGTNAQNLTNPLGKILRINSDGSIPTDNPFVGTPGARTEIWAYGFRNPFRFQFDSLTGKLYVGDVGQDSWEEVDGVIKGGNYGWPQFEGACAPNCGNTQSPIFVYPHSTPSFSITGGPVYRGAAFPASYQGRFFYADYAQGFLRTLGLDTNGNATDSGVNFDASAGGVVDLKVGPDGSLYYVTIFPGKLVKVVYDNGNKYPIASSSANTLTGQPPTAINFSSNGSTDPEGLPLTYLWDFGDGTGTTTPNPTKTYFSKGVYTVQLKVSDGVNTSLANGITIIIGTPPTLSVSNPSSGDTFKAGDTISYAASATDSDGNTLPGTSITREVLLHHNLHTHPFLRPQTGNSGTFTIPTTGESSADIFYELIITATDSNGLTSSKAINIYPQKVSLQFQTIPTGLKVTAGGSALTAPATVDAVIGFNLEISAPEQVMGTTSYEFDSWSDGGTGTHVFAVPSAGGTYVAKFRTIPSFVGEYFSNVSLTGNPTITRQDPAINFTWDDASPDPVLPINNFSVRWTKQQIFEGGRYTFKTATDDGVRLYIDNTLIIDKWIDQAMTTYTASVDLSAGPHQIKMEYYDSAGGAIAKLEWLRDVNQPPPTPTGYRGEYFTNMTLTGSSTVVRNYDAIDFIWNNGSPDPLIPIDRFSARWTKSQNFGAGNYEFTVTADDGVRLYLDGKKIIDGWKDQAMTTYKTIQTLVAGLHDLKIEYYENGGGAIARFNYQATSSAPTPPPADGYSAKYWNTPGVGTAPVIPNRSPDVTRIDPAIDFTWDSASPDSIINQDHFVAVWTRQQDFSAGSYRFTATSDDGVRLYLDNALVIDQWNDHPSTNYVVDKNVSVGTHTVRVEYYENAGGAIAKFNFAPSPVTSTPFTGEYYSNRNLTGSPVLTRSDSLINFVWNDGSPDASIPNDNFSARWTKTETFPEGNHTFSVTADDGVRFYLDGNLLIDKWVDQPSTTYTVTVPVTAGSHTLKMEYYENGGGAVAVFSE